MKTILKAIADKKEGHKTERLEMRMSREEIAKFQAQADKYAKGNISDWLRYAGVQEPKEEDLK